MSNQNENTSPEEVQTKSDNTSTTVTAETVRTPVTPLMERPTEHTVPTRHPIDIHPPQHPHLPNGKPVQGPVTLRVFVQICGAKPDQIAPFVKFAQSRRIGPRTVEQWKRLVTDFGKMKV